MSFNSLSSHLASIEAALRRLDRQILLRSLQGGVSPEVVRNSLAEIHMASTQGIEDFYGWKNGTLTDSVGAIDDICLLPGFYFLSLDDALANYTVFADDSRWDAGWIPLFANGGGDFYVVDLKFRTNAPIRHFRIEQSVHPIEFESLQGMIATIASAFDQGVFYVDPGGYLEMNDVSFAKLAAEINPTIEWWKD